MKLNSKLYPFLMVCLLLSCKKEATLEYKFADKAPLINCEGQDSKLVSEAIYSFEDAMRTFFKSGFNPNGRMDIIYSQFLGQSSKNMIHYEDLVTSHTLEVFHVLKTQKGLWNLENKVSKLDYDSSFFKCIASNIKDDGLKTTLNALLTAHSMNPEIFADPLFTKFRLIENDNALRAYIAFDLFYAKLFDIDETKVNERNNN